MKPFLTSPSKLGEKFAPDLARDWETLTAEKNVGKKCYPMMTTTSENGNLARSKMECFSPPAREPIAALTSVNPFTNVHDVGTSLFRLCLLFYLFLA